MKKILALSLSLLIAMGVLAGCGNTTSTETNQTEETTQTEENTQPETDDVTMEDIEAAVIDAVGGQENYFPATEIPEEVLEGTYGISSDMYTDIYAKMPMISVNVDTLIVVKATDDQVENVKNALLDYQKNAQENLMAYPMNVGKIQASKVEVIGNYVVFAQLGGDTMAYETDEEIMEYCQEQNQNAINTISSLVK